MNFKLTYSSNLINCNALINLDVKKINNDFSNIISVIDNNILEDWTILINIIYDGSIDDRNNKISIGKRGVTYSSDKEKWISIGIPLPSEKNIKWGIPLKCISSRPPLIEKYYEFIDVDYTTYDNILDYAEYAILKGVKALFEIGISLKGYKIKIG